ncbi:MAG: hypothetical protein NVSMB29_00020 [Candidatus Dormibacteria bacterium]
MLTALLTDALRLDDGGVRDTPTRCATVVRLEHDRSDRRSIRIGSASVPKGATPLDLTARTPPVPLQLARTPPDPSVRSSRAIAAGGVGVLVLVALLLTGFAQLHRPRQPPPSVGQVLKIAQVQSTDGVLTLRSRPIVVLTFASGLDAQSRDNLRQLMSVVPALHRRGVTVLGLSVDELPVLESVKRDLGLSFPLAGEGPGRGHHPLSAQLGIFHGPPNASDSPVDATGLFSIAANGRVERSVVTQAGAALPPDALRNLP